MRVDAEAWNGFVLGSEHRMYALGDGRRDAAIASEFLALANNGGLFHYLDVAHDLGGSDIVEALDRIGAPLASLRIRAILEVLSTRLEATTREARSAELLDSWTDELDAADFVDEVSEIELVAALERHVTAHADYYRTLPPLMAPSPVIS